MYNEIGVRVAPNNWHESNPPLQPPAGVTVSGPVTITKYGIDAADALGFVFKAAYDVALPVIAMFIYDYFKRHDTPQITIHFKQIIHLVKVDLTQIQLTLERAVENISPDRHDLDELIDEGYVFQFPLFTYMLGKGPHFGYLGALEKGVVLAPVWTDADLYRRYAEKEGWLGKHTGVRISDANEFAAYLESLPESITRFVVDPPTDGNIFSVFEVAVVLEQIKKQG